MDYGLWTMDYGLWTVDSTWTVVYGPWTNVAVTPDQVTVVIPAHNEAPAIGGVVAGVRAVLGPQAELLVVDDGSTDDTAVLAERAGATVIRHPYRIGNGAAVKAGLRRARGSAVVLMDGDGQHDPADIPRLLAVLETHDLVVGARRAGSAGGWHRRLANAIYNGFASYITGRPIQDLTSGFRAIRRHVARPLLYLLPNTFSYPTTLTLAVLRVGRSLQYVPITAHLRAGRSKIRLAIDGSRFCLILLKVATLFAPMRVFLPASAVCLTTGLVYYTYTFLHWHRFTNMSALLLTTGMTVFLMGLVAEEITQLRFERSEDDAS